MHHTLSKLNTYVDRGIIPARFGTLLQDFYANYQKTLGYSEKNQQVLEKLLELIVENIQHPYVFPVFHQGIRQPFDYYQFGLDFIRPFIDFKHSKILGIEVVKTIEGQLKKKENVILFANHQTEPDPQIISLLLESIESKLASHIIFMAGHRVISDPMAIPMSLGHNLLCIYSKKHMLYPPEKKAEKVLHNQRTLKKMQELLNEGGYCIYVAPSGGRDRPNAEGEVEVAPFDPQSIELFWLMGQQATRTTHFYPLALKTYPLMPPPSQVEKEVGEKRMITITPVYAAFGEEIEMEDFPGYENKDKKTKRYQRAHSIWNKVNQYYHTFH